MSQKNINSKGRGSGIEEGKGKCGLYREIKSKSTKERKQYLLKEGNASPGPSQGTKRPATNDSNEEEAKKMNVDPSEGVHSQCPTREPAKQPRKPKKHIDDLISEGISQYLEGVYASRDRIPSTKRGRAKGSRIRK